MNAVDVAVIGRGLIGAAAARYLARAGWVTALIGPDEPADRLASQGPFSSHPDEGRITRIAGRTLVWSEMALRSIRRYADIEQRSGISFHTPSGLAITMPELDEWIDNGLIVGSAIRKVDPDWLRQTTGIVAPEGLSVAYEGAPAGHINPRRLVEAQTKLTEAAGGTVVREAVTSISVVDRDFEISGEWGTITAARVLIATGAFGSSLLDVDLDVHLDLERRPRTVLQAEVADTEANGRLPSLIAHRPADPRLDGIYWVPPVRYPDGRLCLKIGGNLASNPVVDSEDELIDWFHSDGDPDEIEALEVTLRALLPDTEFTSITSTPCVVTGTPSEHPYIGWVGDGVAVALGGNGSAAKSSDELGRLAATLFELDGWNDSLDQAHFEPPTRVAELD